MKPQTNYQNQAKEIKALASEIIKKANRFKKKANSPYFDDLTHVLSELKEINSFLNC